MYKIIHYRIDQQKRREVLAHHLRCPTLMGQVHTTVWKVWQHCFRIENCLVWIYLYSPFRGKSTRRWVFITSFCVNWCHCKFAVDENFSAIVKGSSSSFSNKSASMVTSLSQTISYKIITFSISWLTRPISMATAGWTDKRWTLYLRLCFSSLTLDTAVDISKFEATTSEECKCPISTQLFVWHACTHPHMRMCTHKRMHACAGLYYIYTCMLHICLHCRSCMHNLQSRSVPGGLQYTERWLAKLQGTRLHDGTTCYNVPMYWWKHTWGF